MFYSRWMCRRIASGCGLGSGIEYGVLNAFCVCGFGGISELEKFGCCASNVTALTASGNVCTVLTRDLTFPRP